MDLYKSTQNNWRYNMTNETTNRIISITSHGKKYEFDTAEWDLSVILAHATQGLKIRLDRSSASLTKSEGFKPDDKLEACDKLYNSLKTGIMPKSGGGSRLTPNERAFNIVLKSQIKYLKGEKQADCLIRLSKSLAEKQKVDFTDEMVQKVRDVLENTSTYKDALAAELAKTNPVSVDYSDLVL